MIHKNIASLFLGIIILCTVSATPTSRPEQEDPSIFSSQWSRPALGLACLFFYWVKSPADSKKKIEEHLHPASLLLNVICQYSTYWSATLAHEAGHSLMGQYLTGESSTIHMGYADHNKDRAPLVTVGNVRIEGANPLVGHTHSEHALSQEEGIKLISSALALYAKKNSISACTLTDKKTLEKILSSPDFKRFLTSFDRDKKTYAAILLAGGAAGVAYSHLLKLITSGPKKALSIDPITVNNLCNMFIPLAQDSDAAQLYKNCLGLSPDIIDNLVVTGQTMKVVWLIGLYFYQSYNGSQTTKHTTIDNRIVLAFINYLLMGYLRIYA